MRTTVFTIDGMNCDVCANTIKSAVERQPGVKMAAVSFSERQARVLYDPQSVGKDQIADVIQGKGFRVIGTDATV